MAESEIVAPSMRNGRRFSIWTPGNNPNEFAAAKASADRVGFTFGNCQGYGHGARATAPVKFVVLRRQYYIVTSKVGGKDNLACVRIR